ncbi:malate dehydrogenase (quinone) [Erwinia billingiae]|uniref:malate dehydrogenase (quinone) n=1 Tax=Erwinia billingiae TaxID=182337 RepID=UPI001247E92E|nr:malate dehydrogenase (quinone) [Erwinia billingiae]MBN7124385.1 malate:quinone oxidoreductase [Erwinia billingiae]QEW34126.1 malate dehydrogenase (quinone) [Erwinia billingiae]
MRNLAVRLAGWFNAISLAKSVTAEEEKNDVDVLLIGGGIMSATLGTYLQELEPTWRLGMVERLDSIAEESSNGWNNAGTGHSALAEMNYTPEKSDGSIEIKKAVEINESFQISRQFWAYQVQKGNLQNPRSFINSVPHMSFVWGDDNVEFLKKRFEALQKSTLFRGMEYSEDAEKVREWVPLMMEGREATDRVAATRILTGTDVNFGEITHQLVNSLQKSPQFSLKTSHEVRDIKRNEDGSWSVTLADLKNNGQEKTLRAKYVFIGAGGAGLTLLQKSGIPEVKDYAGFPVGGEFLVSENPDVVKRHLAKVYGKASVGAPPMSVPHLDTRMLDGKQTLLFGPFATFSTKFLKQGSLLDMFGSLTSSNIKPMLHVGLSNFDLVKYLVGQVMLTDDDRLKALQEYFPEARKEDWRLVKAGQRVQIIKKDADKGGVLKLGTEVVTSQDGTISALLGASPGASTAAPIMIDLMAKVFEDRFSSMEWQAKLKTMIPSYGRKLNGNVAATEKELAETSRVLQLEYTPTSAANDEAEEANAAVIGK